MTVVEGEEPGIVTPPIIEWDDDDDDGEDGHDFIHATIEADGPYHKKVKKLVIYCKKCGKVTLNEYV